MVRASKTRRMRKGGSFNKTLFANKPGNNAGTIAAKAAVEAFMKLIPDKDDYERMQFFNSKAVDKSKNYASFVGRQRYIAYSLNGDDNVMLRKLCELMSAQKVRSIDLEYCSSIKTQYIFFDKERKIVFVTPR